MPKQKMAGRETIKNVTPDRPLQILTSPLRPTSRPLPLSLLRLLLLSVAVRFLNNPANDYTNARPHASQYIPTHPYPPRLAAPRRALTTATTKQARGMQTKADREDLMTDRRDFAAV